MSQIDLGEMQVPALMPVDSTEWIPQGHRGLLSAHIVWRVHLQGYLVSWIDLGEVQVSVPMPVNGIQWIPQGH